MLGVDEMVSSHRQGGNVLECWPAWILVSPSRSLFTLLAVSMLWYYATHRLHASNSGTVRMLFALGLNAFVRLIIQRPSKQAIKQAEDHLVRGPERHQRAL